jgi:hypothetical protein
VFVLKGLFAVESAEALAGKATQATHAADSATQAAPRREATNACDAT